MQTLEQHLENRIPKQCEKCGQFGFVGKQLFRHNKNKPDEKILCHYCHLREHEKRGLRK